MGKKSKSEERMESLRHHILICQGSSCSEHDSGEVLEAMRKSVKKEGLDEHVRITETGCMLRCSQSPTVVVYPEGVWYQNMTREAAKRLVKEHLIQGNILAAKAQYRYAEGKFHSCKLPKAKKPE
ncbi:(2Fe-2S) ferredoxin domain-containing protein [Paenibacillus hemerocallicola]|jgi:(2Fe-2S) ferredoxin|uniref:(2Fe-2S) ferredoxin domain-containing protein n=1 Tax=Paenibacillus hemerocallicola TaxID=1172614 RepID=A0A5C4SV54_9BACL|nr:(2Fe-2S) ferredoxin domain-containing protein [Paenibacillus hemerocallicola]TNJ54251.1 (2Fe-2S) ferredoxin domain-containing protein [Paenibacillus hemerocallicola]